MSSMSWETLARHQTLAEAHGVGQAWCAMVNLRRWQSAARARAVIHGRIESLIRLAGSPVLRRETDRERWLALEDLAGIAQAACDMLRADKDGPARRAHHPSGED